MSYSMQFVATPLPTSDENLIDRIKDAATRATRNASCLPTTSSSSLTIQQQQTIATSAPSLPPPVPPTLTTTPANQLSFNAIKSVPVIQITVGPRHIALLLEDGRICRVSYQVLADRLEFPPMQNIIPTPASGPTNVNSASSSLPNAAINAHQQVHQSPQIVPSAPGSQHNKLQSAIASPPNSLPLGSAINPAPIGTAPGASPSNLGVAPLGTSNPGSVDSRTPYLSGQPPASSSSAPGSSSGLGLSRANLTLPQVSASGLSAHRQAARRGRMLRQAANRGRGATSVIMGSRAVIPAQYVPEDLINQAQVVLQGKPRSAIVRELQRTNLDVNSAVNNLLSSDNEDPEDVDESQDYLPNEDLMSLLDSSLPSGGPASVLIDAETVFPEDVFNNYPSGRLRTGNLRHSLGSSRSSADREAVLSTERELLRMTSPRDHSSRRWLEYALRDTQPVNESMGNRLNATATDFTSHKSDNHGLIKKSQLTDSSPIQISDTIELWPTNDKKFVQIACMHSELIAISSSGQLNQWKWNETQPFEGVRNGEIINYHSKTSSLNLTHEKVTFLSASCIRATVITESNRVATWVDESINVVASRLEHQAQSFPEFQRGDKISQLHTCSLYSCVRLESGAIYWWGIAPFSQRKKNWKKFQTKSSKQHSGNGSEITVGSIVCLKNGPSFSDGAIGFTTSYGVPRVGRLIMSAWNITDTCTFKLLHPSEHKKGNLHLPPQQSSEPKSSSTSCARTRKIGQPIDFSALAGADDNSSVAPASPGMSKNSSSERLEMPPPPSPASSTCSEPGCSPSHKRKHKHSLSIKEEDKTKDEEQWNLKDVVFIEEVKKPPVAKVIKLDGNTALVRFNQRDPFAHVDSDVNAYLQDCRMIRKEDLQMAKDTSASSRMIDCQRSPKKLNISDSNNFLTFTVSNNGVHAVVKEGSKIEYKIYQLASGRVSKSLSFPTDATAFLGRDPSLITLHASGESDVAVTLRDGNGALYPLSKDCLNSIKEPLPLDMPPVQALAMAVHPVKDPASASNRVHPTLVAAMALESQILIPAVLRSDPEFVRLTLASLEREPVSQQIVASERIDLNRNILHAAVRSCAPTSNKVVDPAKVTKLLDEALDVDPQRFYSSDFKRSRLSKQTSQANTASSSLDLTSQDNDNSRSMSGLSDLEQTSNFELPSIDGGDYIVDPSEQKQSAHTVLWILVESQILQPFLKDLMIQKDAFGMTPFMSAVSSRAYSAALILLDAAQKIVSQEKQNLDTESQHRLLMSFIFPRGTNLDNNPIYMTCANDTCSFTWTGAHHINQDIFECKTCGLTRTLCCCSECARVCHKGHECRIKKTSPTAYCDCWEKCKCKSLVAGSQVTRYKLLERLLTDTDLVSYPDTKGESILLFLVQTVGRQLVEQRQYVSDQRQRHHNKSDEPSDMPEIDLAPPRFARKALDRMLGEWLAVKTTIMAGTNASQNLASTSKSTSLLNAEDQIFLSGQQGTALLDRFTHSILIKIGHEMLDALLTAIIKQASSLNTDRILEAKLVAKRFVRSVARVGVVLSIELSPINYAQQQQSNILDMSNSNSSIVTSGVQGSPVISSIWKRSSQPASILQKCRKVFQALVPIAAEELAEIADALISPVRLGVPRPTAPFSLVTSMAEATQASEEIFVVDPVILPGSSNTSAINSNRLLTNDPLSSGHPSTSNNQANDGSVVANNTAQAHRLRHVLYDQGDLVSDAMDSEDAEASNNTFRQDNHDDSDSESDSNPDDASFQSNLDGTPVLRNVAGAPAGSEVGASTVAYFSEVDSGDSSNAEEDEEESEANDTEHDTDDLSFSRDGSITLNSRRGAFNYVFGSGAHSESGSSYQQNLSVRPNLAQHLHWALRHRDQPSTSLAQGSSLPQTAARLASLGLSAQYNYLDGTSVRRTVPSANAQLNLANGVNSEFSMATTAIGLARAFSIIIRSISDLIPILRESERSDSALTINQLKVSPTEAATIICNLEKKLNSVWKWLFKVMDSTEGQLRFGCALTNGTQALSQVNAGSSIVPGSSSSLTQQQLSHRSSSAFQANLHAHPSYIQNIPSSSSAQNHNVPPGMGLRVSHVTLPSATSSRRLPGAFDETTTRIHSSSAVSAVSAASSSADSQVPRPPPVTGIVSAPSVPRAQTLSTNRASLGAPGYIRMPVGSGVDTAEGAVVDGTAARRDFLSYMISLIRSHGNEHHDSLPILDVSSLRHVAYVFDAYIYYLQALNRQKTEKPFSEQYSEMERDFEEVVLSLTQNSYQNNSIVTSMDEELSSPWSSTNRGPKHSFFRRTDSTLFLDCIAPDPFKHSISETLPLAEQPHLLQPTSRREDLFGVSKINPQDINLASLPMKMSLSSSSMALCSKCIAMKQQQQIVQSLTTMPSLRSDAAATMMIMNQQQNLFNDKPALLCPVHQRLSGDPEIRENIAHTVLLGRWKLSVELFGREFVDDVGAEPGSILTDLVGFPLKENRFRREMERLRNESSREITLTAIDRDRNTLIRQTFKELNNAFHSSERNRRNPELPLLACSKVKVSFKDEKGEGNGVARSFYTAFCEAVLSNEKLPNLDNCQVNSRPSHLNLQRIKPKEQVRRVYTQQQQRSIGNLIQNPSPSYPPNMNPSSAVSSQIETNSTQSPAQSANTSASQLPHSSVATPTASSSSNSQPPAVDYFNLSTHSRSNLTSSSNSPNPQSAFQFNPNTSPKGIPTTQDLSQALLVSNAAATASAAATTATVVATAYAGISSLNAPRYSIQDDIQPAEDNAPLFYEPGLRNFYCPRQGRSTQERINAFRNVGRIIGICLSLSEICPIQLNRHVIKYILRRPISWHDLAFFDPVLYESLRKLILDAEKNPDAASLFQSLDLRFYVDLSPEEGGPGQVELVPGGRNIEVTCSNIYEYVRLYALRRMYKSQEKSLQALKQGVLDALPSYTLDNLTAEDFRLLLNGVGEISVQTLISYTSFIDDRGNAAGKRNSVEMNEQLGYFKKWFWSIVEKMTTKERQDLIYFWTGSPSLPASEEGFQPMPTVSIRPAEDLHLPTSNVCIFRLYIPLYSSKAILRNKLLIAIKEKNFGFI